MKSRSLSWEELSGVAGGSPARTACRAGMTAGGILLGGAIGLPGTAYPPGVALTTAVGAVNAGVSLANKQPFMAGVDAGMAGLGWVPGAGAVGGAYTYGKGAWNLSSGACPK